MKENVVQQPRRAGLTIVQRFWLTRALDLHWFGMCLAGAIITGGSATFLSWVFGQEGDMEFLRTVGLIGTVALLVIAAAGVIAKVWLSPTPEELEAAAVDIEADFRKKLGHG